MIALWVGFGPTSPWPLGPFGGTVVCLIALVACPSVIPFRRAATHRLRSPSRRDDRARDEALLGARPPLIRVSQPGAGSDADSASNRSCLGPLGSAWRRAGAGDALPGALRRKAGQPFSRASITSRVFGRCPQHRCAGGRRARSGSNQGAGARHAAPQGRRARPFGRHRQLGRRRALRARARRRIACSACSCPSATPSGDSLALGRLLAVASRHRRPSSRTSRRRSRALAATRARTTPSAQVFPEYGDGWKCKIALPSILDSDRCNVFQLTVQSRRPASSGRARMPLGAVSAARRRHQLQAARRAR